MTDGHSKVNGERDAESSAGVSWFPRHQDIIMEGDGSEKLEQVTQTYISPTAMARS